MSARKKPELLLRLGTAIRELRRAQNLTQLQFADKTGCTLNHVGMVERGERKISVLMLARFAKALGLTAEQLCGAAGI